MFFKGQIANRIHSSLQKYMRRHVLIVLVLTQPQRKKYFFLYAHNPSNLPFSCTSTKQYTIYIHVNKLLFGSAADLDNNNIKF